MSIRELVREAYSAVAIDPKGKHAFPCGEDFALSLGYSQEVLGHFDQGIKEAFAGVSNVSVLAEIPGGSAVLDLGCGAGLDSMIAAVRTGPAGRVIGIDFSGPMIEKARTGSRGLGIHNVDFIMGDGEDLPIRNGSIDLAMINGIFNLNPQRGDIFREMARVLVPGGQLFAAELILTEPLKEDEKKGEGNWFA